MTHQDQQIACTGDVWCGCVCHACTVSFSHCRPPAGADLGQLPVRDADIERITQTALRPWIRRVDSKLLRNGAANMITLAIEDISDMQDELQTRAAGDLWAHVDLVRALRHLRAASRLVDSVADRIDSPAVSR